MVDVPGVACEGIEYFHVLIVKGYVESLHFSPAQSYRKGKAVVAEESTFDLNLDRFATVVSSRMG